MNINTSVQCVEMVKILKTDLQTSNIKRFEKLPNSFKTGGKEELTAN